MGIVIKNVSEDRFEVVDEPSRAIVFVAFVFLAISGGVSICSSGRIDAIPLYLVYGLAIFVLMEIGLRGYRSVVDREIGIVTGGRVGLFGGPVGATSTKVAITEIEGIEVKPGWFGESYQIRVRRKNGKTLAITGMSRGFRESQILSQQISAFLGFSGVSEAVD